MKLTEKQRKHLRRLGHDLKPVVMVGSSGLTDTVLTEIDGALSHHELVKARIRVSDRTKRDRILEEISAKFDAVLIQRVGNVALFYRPAEEPKLILPEPGN